MPTIPYWHIDAFADRPFAGNQAAVMLLDAWLPDAVLQAIGEENNFAETAFLVPDATGAADWELRWFTPTSEVALCGHATLASGHVLLTRDGTERVTFRTRRSGVLEVRRAPAGYELALPVTRVVCSDNDPLLTALGCAGKCFESVSGAEQTAIILLENEAAIRALAPDMRALCNLDVMAICTAPGTRTDVVSRVFVPAWGIDEDAVTGSAHAALAPFWAERLGRDHFTAHQASTRGGDLTCRLEGEQAWLGGNCVTVVEGRFFLPDA
jgi:predicted PhzF superfamily epimerase YddE/YHI9